MDQKNAEEEKIEKKQEVAKVEVKINGRKKILPAEVNRSAGLVRPLDPQWEIFVFGFGEVRFVKDEGR